MRRVGFTLIEVLITIIVITILLIVAVALMRNGEANARDDTRKTDVTEIAQQLDSFYNSGTNGSTSIGQYPGLDLVAGSSPCNPPTAAQESTTKSTLRDLDWKALRAPGISTSSPMSLLCAPDNTTTQNPTIGQFIYQPLTSTGALCTTTSSGCRKFVIYYRLETNTSTVQTLMSRYQ